MRMHMNLGMHIIAIFALTFLGVYVLAALYLGRAELEGPVTMPSSDFLIRVFAASAALILLINALVFRRRNYPFNGYLFLSRSTFQVALFLSLVYGLFFFVLDPVTGLSFAIPGIFFGILFFRATRWSINGEVKNAEYGDSTLSRENTIAPSSKVVIRTAGIEADNLSVELPAGTEVGLRTPQSVKGRLCYEFPIPMPETSCELRIFKMKGKKRILREYKIVPLEEGSILVPLKIQIELPDLKKTVETRIRKGDLTSGKKVLDVARKVFTEQSIYHPIEDIHVFTPTSSIPKEQNILKDMNLTPGDTLIIRET